MEKWKNSVGKTALVWEPILIWIRLLSFLQPCFKTSVKILLLVLLLCLHQPALVFWLNEGVDGVQLDGVERVSTVVPSLWSDIRAIVQNETQEHPNKRFGTVSYWQNKVS